MHAALIEAAEALAGSGVIVAPTDTVYGVLARIDRPDAIAKIFVAKTRPKDKALGVLVSSEAEARDLADFDQRADALAAEGWPGPLTLVLPRKGQPHHIDLGGDPATIGLRVPGISFTRDLLESTGPLVATSANRSGDTATTIEQIVEQLGGEVTLYIDGGALTAPPSRVVSLIGEAKKLR